MKYDIILADPPWPYNSPRMVCESGTAISGVEDHYKTMTIEELYSLPVGGLAAKNCLLYLWATGPKLAEAMECIRQWKFKFVTVAYVWDKQHPLPGYYSCSQVEFVLVAKRGRCPRRTSTTEKQFVSSRRQRHSQKPERVQDSIDKQWDSTAQKIELFARREREGWTTVGNECPSTLGVDIKDWLSQSTGDIR